MKVKSKKKSNLEWLHEIHSRQEEENFDVSDVPPNVRQVLRRCKLLSHGIITAQAMELLS